VKQWCPLSEQHVHPENIRLTFTAMNLKTYITVLFWKLVQTSKGPRVWYSCIESLVLACDWEFEKPITNHLKIRIYETVILPVVLYGCETWSLTLREEHRLRVLRRIFGLKRDEVTGGWRKLCRNWI
jgi:hypothetical protein